MQITIAQSDGAGNFEESSALQAKASHCPERDDANFSGFLMASIAWPQACPERDDANFSGFLMASIAWPQACPEHDDAYFSGDRFFDNGWSELHSTVRECWEVVRHYPFR